MERWKYDRAYFEREYWKEDFGEPVPPYGRHYSDPTHALRFDFMADVVSPYLTNELVLDAGSGPGFLTSALNARGRSVVACDWSDAAINIAAVHGCHEFVQADLCDLPFSSASFDVVICLDALEHVLPKYAPQAIAEIGRVARRLIIASINLDNPYEYHPSMLSRLSWEELFQTKGRARADTALAEALAAAVCPRYPEYEFFAMRPLRR